MNLKGNISGRDRDIHRSSQKRKKEREKGGKKRYDKINKNYRGNIKKIFMN